MARIRTIKPEFWQDEKLSPCPVIDRLVFLGLISMADDAGRLLDNLKVIDAFIFPETGDTARESLARLSRINRIRRGMTSSGQPVIQIVNWGHQKVDHPNLKSALPPIVKERTDLPEIREAFANDSREIRDSINDLLPVPPTIGALAPEKRQSKTRTVSTGVTWLTPFGEDWKQELSGVPNYKAMAKPFEQLLTIHTVEEIRPVWRAYLRGTKGQPYPVQPQRFCENFGKYQEQIRPLSPADVEKWVAQHPVRQ